MLPILWSASALDDLDEITNYIWERNPAAAERMHVLLEASVLPIAEHPYLYRPGRVAGTREIVAHPNYILVYRVAADHIEIVNVVHSRREYP